MKKIYWVIGGVLVVIIATVVVLSTIKTTATYGAVTGRGNYSERTWMNEVAATTTASNIAVSNVADFANVGLTVSTASASGTLKFACSMSDTSPLFMSAQSATNRWDYVDFTDTQNNTSIDGDTGIVLTNTTDVRQFYITTNNFRWCTAILTPWTAGTVTVKMLPANSN